MRKQRFVTLSLVWFSKITVNLGAFAIQTQRDFAYVKNDKTRIRAKCKDNGCPWLIFASVERKKKYFQVKGFTEQHTCYANHNISWATSVWMADEYKELIVGHPGIKPSYIKHHINTDFGLEFSINQCRRTKVSIMNKLERNVKEEYAKLGDYANALRLANPGSTVVIKVMDESVGCTPVFQRMYVCLAVVKKGFLEGCRPFVGLDGCFLKGVVKGQLLTAVGKDGSNQMYLLA